MATGHVLYLGLHVTGLMKSADPMHANNNLYIRRVRSFWAYFSVDRYVNLSKCQYRITKLLIYY